MSFSARTLLAAFSLGWIAVAGGLTALAWNDGQMLDLEIGSFTSQAWIDGDTAAKALFTLVMAALMAIGLAGFLLAFMRKSATPSGVLRLKQAEGGIVEVPASALEALVVHALGEMDVIAHAEASVALRGGTVATELDLTIGPGATISEVTAGANDCISDVLRDMVGVTNVRRPLVRITIDGTLPKSGWASDSAAGESEALEPEAKDDVTGEASDDD
jgi:hypothetical protein